MAIASVCQDWRTEVSHVQQAIFVTLALLAPICAARQPIAWFARCRGMKKRRLRPKHPEHFGSIANVRPSARSVARSPRRQGPRRNADLIGSRPIAEVRYAKRRTPIAS
ncbi:hypothetical protein A5686_25540 [Mycobacterium sp. E2479]|nr:hypothetical protein A5686_25540 [Mycobacterium sp. E2479]